jgi:DNA-binding response OmpR family regulator
VRLLIIEDEPRIAEILKSGLQRAGFAVDVMHRCADARSAGTDEGDCATHVPICS